VQDGGIFPGTLLEGKQVRENLFKKCGSSKNVSILERKKMKKMIILGLFAMALVFTASPVGAYSYPADILITPVSGAMYTNPTSSLPNSETDTETAFLSNILGFSVSLIDVKDQSPVNGAILLDGYYPGFAWTYAVIKFDGKNDGWYGIEDQGDDLLTFGPGFATNPAGEHYAISHATFFNGSTPGTPVPEPTTLILLGLGLIGVAGARRKMRG
jgi:hypothetical protein